MSKISNLFIVFLLFGGCSSVNQSKSRVPANQDRVSGIEAELLDGFGIKISAGGDSGSYESTRSTGLFGLGGEKDYTSYYNSKPGASNYLNFINALLQKAKSTLEGPLFFPVETVIVVKEQNSMFDDKIELEGSGRISVHYSIKNADNVLKYLAANFAVQGTPEAEELRIYSAAIRSAIVDMMSELKEKGIEVMSCSDLINGLCRYKGEDSISYFHQEKLLRGLIHIAIRVERGVERRASINLIEYSDSDGDKLKYMPSWYNFKLKKQINNRFDETIKTYSAKIKT